MLRIAALVLIAANLVFLGWSRGWLDGALPWPSTGDREPQRLARQVRPDAIVLHPEVPSTSTSAAAPTLACVESGPYAAAEVAGARALLAPLLPAERIAEVPEPGGAVRLRVDRAEDALANQLLALRAEAVRDFRRCGAPG